MLSRLLLVADVLLVAAAGWLGIELYRVWTALPPRLTVAATPGPAPEPPPAPAPAPAEEAAAPPFATFAVVAERNLFSPTRSEVVPEPPKPPTPAAAPTPPAPPPPKPRLYGVVLGSQEGGRAYLEDPRTRKVFPYAVGDSVAESRLERIEIDRVVLRRGSETYEVLLRDPSKPRPAPAPPTRAAPRAPLPGAPRGAVPGTPEAGQVVPVPGAPAPETSVTPAPGVRAPVAPGGGVRRPPIRVPAAPPIVTPAQPEAQEPPEDEPQ